ncbi:hypothetical protein K435DRAFT_758143 [Dendrothele bispora CBS 962.96]|uniref:Uncharacterized protein n=1 Tax=Dendrothele bispora (strain CBS 962.96) TaxID=1314807 RepID=A0A4S8LTD8_DENBC|nr:hypothetical protein K435DRAFT_758143 [Dendrothele bispora CBS 962.96]
MNLLAWDGRTPTPIFSSGAEGRLCALLVGSPDEENWSSVNVDATELLEAHRSNISSKEHRRGQFMCRDVGVSHSTDTAKPYNLVHNEKETQTLDTLCQHKIFKRLSGFANSIFATWAPRLYSYYSTCQKKLLESDPSLKPPFPNSIWSTATFDFGPQTICFPRVGDSNLPFEWCAIWALGDYDPKQSAHLILWDLRLVIEFPPGSLVFIPSGILVRSNVSIRQHEKRYSFTQYTPGSLFRWVDDQGCQEQTEHGVSQTDAQVQEEEAEKAKKRWTTGLELLPTFSELKLSSSS